MFLLKEVLKSFVYSRKIRVGFILDVLPAPYFFVMASTRIRAYDVIRGFAKDSEFFLELYKPWKRYDIVIFQKSFRTKHLKLARKLKAAGTLVVLDVNINVFDKNAVSPYSGKTFFQEVKEFSTEINHFLVSSPDLLTRAQKTFPEVPVTLIEENLPDQLFTVQKNTSQQPKTLVYAGYAVKASELLVIKRVLQELYELFPFRILLLCEENPRIKIGNIPIIFCKYQQKIIQHQLLKGDIFLSPRNMTLIYNQSHSFTKIGLPMSVGLPVIASNIPAYVGSPALLCETELDWKRHLTALFEDTALRQEISQKGRVFCQENFGIKHVLERYRIFFRSIKKA